MELHQEISYLKHFNGKYSVVFSFHFKCADVCNYDGDIMQLEVPENTYRLLTVNFCHVYLGKDLNKSEKMPTQLHLSKTNSRHIKQG